MIEPRRTPGGARGFVVSAFVCLFVFRLLSVFLIRPLNAPDEAGHLIVVTSLARGHLLTLEEEFQYLPRYPYATFCPAPYLPSAGLLALASRFSPDLLRLDQPEPHFSSATVFIARLGQLFWTGLFAVFLILLLEPFPLLIRWTGVVLIGLLPQLVFVQSYLNLDAMGTAVVPFLLWTLRERRLGLVTLAVLLTLLSKLNYLCLLPLPVCVLWAWAMKEPRLRWRHAILAFAVPLVAVSPWYVTSYFRNTRQYGSVLGFGALLKLYPDPPGRWDVMKRSFLGLTLNSGFGIFGHFTLPLPIPYFWIWKAVFVPLGLVAMLAATIRKLPQAAWHRGLLVVYVANWALHYLASFTGALSPQGRYLFPAFFIQQGYLIYALATDAFWPGGGTFPFDSRTRRSALGLLTGFVGISAIAGLYYSAGN